VLAPLGLLRSRRFTCFMGMEKLVSEAHFKAQAVVVDGAIITSRAAGTAAEFAEALIHALAGPLAARELAEKTWQHWIREV
jgi:4-methyl-5(b-hydroxyethyl)-thiazole monophosphate biosynthesis